MATKTKIGLVFEYDLLTVFFDDNTKTDNPLSTVDTTALMEMLNTKNNSLFTIKFVNIVIGENIALFSEAFYSETQQMSIFNMSDFTTEEQTIINDFINLL